MEELNYLVVYLTIKLKMF